MKRLMSFILSILSLSFLNAQIQSLPDLNINGESNIKTYLYKRTLRLAPMLSSVDSLPPFIPSRLPDNNEIAAGTDKISMGFFQLEANTSFGLNSYFSFYPKHSVLSNISHFMDLRLPETGVHNFQNRLIVGGQFISALPITIKLDHTSAKVLNYKGSYYDTSVAHHRKTLDFHYFKFEELNLHLGASNIRQNNLSDVYKRDFLNTYLSQIVTTGNLNVKAQMFYQNGEAGIIASPLLRSKPSGISPVRLSLMADAYRIIPSMEFSYRLQISEKGVFSFSNTPSMESNSFSSILAKDRWVQLSDNHKLKKTPVDFVSTIEFRYIEQSGINLRKLNVANRFIFEVHSPILVSSENRGVPLAVFQDIISNQTEIQAFFQYNGIGLHQDISTVFAYNSNTSLRRVAYRQALSLNTQAYYKYHSWMFNLDFEQSYFNIDHHGEGLSDTHLCDVGTEYRFGDSVVYAQFANIFNSQQWVFNEYPFTGRYFCFGLKHRF